MKPFRVAHSRRPPLADAGGRSRAGGKVRGAADADEADEVEVIEDYKGEGEGAASGDEDEDEEELEEEGKEEEGTASSNASSDDGAEPGPYRFEQLLC